MESPSRIVAHPHVQMDRSILGGSPHLRGTRIPVRRLWAWHRQGATVETLLRRYPQLGPARVLDALAFAYDNEALVENDLAHERRWMARAGAEKTPAHATRGTPSSPPDDPFDNDKGKSKLRRNFGRNTEKLPTCCILFWRT